jgi:hypothetical protein
MDMLNGMAASELRMSLPKRREDVASRLVDGEMIVLDRQRGFIHQLNKTATFVWERCDGKHRADEIAMRMCENFTVDEPTALHDVIHILNELRKLALVNNEDQ